MNKQSKRIRIASAAALAVLSIVGLGASTTSPAAASQGPRSWCC